jgi:hypothetical protein
VAYNWLVINLNNYLRPSSIRLHKLKWNRIIEYALSMLNHRLVIKRDVITLKRSNIIRHNLKLAWRLTQTIESNSESHAVHPVASDSSKCLDLVIQADALGTDIVGNTISSFVPCDWVGVGHDSTRRNTPYFIFTAQRRSRWLYFKWIFDFNISYSSSSRQAKRHDVGATLAFYQFEKCNFINVLMDSRSRGEESSSATTS